MAGLQARERCYCGDEYTVTANSNPCQPCLGDGVSECGLSTGPKTSIYNINNTEAIPSKR